MLFRQRKHLDTVVIIIVGWGTCIIVYYSMLIILYKYCACVELIVLSREFELDLSKLFD